MWFSWWLSCWRATSLNYLVYTELFWIHIHFGFFLNYINPNINFELIQRKKKPHAEFQPEANSASKILGVLEPHLKWKFWCIKKKKEKLLLKYWEESLYFSCCPINVEYKSDVLNIAAAVLCLSRILHWEQNFWSKEVPECCFIYL